MLLHRPGGAPFAVKRDQFGSDLLAVNDQAIWFVQVKLGRNSIAAAVREFRTFPCPPGCKQIVAVWELRGRYPELIDAAEYVIRGDKKGAESGSLFDEAARG
jgi:hypothetical protein